MGKGMIDGYYVVGIHDSGESIHGFCTSAGMGDATMCYRHKGDYINT